MNKTICRPRQHVEAAGKLYPGAWKQADDLRSGRGIDLPDWPDWCFLPLAGWYAILSQGQKIPLHLVPDVAKLGAVGAWRVTQGIYRFDPALYEALIATPLDGELPCDVLYHMPEWCVYIETPGMSHAGETAHGAFAYMEHDANTGRAELRVLVDTETALLPVILHLGTWSLQEALKKSMQEAKRQAIFQGWTQTASEMPEEIIDALSDCVAPVLALLLYLCSQNAEIGDGTRIPRNPAPKQTKRGPRIFAAEKSTTWDVGVRIGAALRKAYHSSETTGAQERTSPRPHIRRAHWHGFWTGPKNTPGERKLRLKWMPPIPVNLDDAELPAVVRPVKS